MGFNKPYWETHEVAATVRPLREATQDLLGALPEYKPYSELGQTVENVQGELVALTKEIGE